MAAIITLLGSVWSAPAGVAAQPFREYDLKAVFLVNLASFVEWPPEAFASERSPFVIAVLGGDPFGRALDIAAAGQEAKGRRLIVRRARRAEEVRDCHIVFVSSSEAPRLRAVVRELAGRPVLTVSDIPNFTGAGGMIGLVLEDRRIVLYADPKAASAAALDISSKLLRLARINEPAALVPPPALGEDSPHFYVNLDR